VSDNHKQSKNPSLVAAMLHERGPTTLDDLVENLAAKHGPHFSQAGVREDLRALMRSGKVEFEPVIFGYGLYREVGQ